MPPIDIDVEEEACQQQTGGTVGQIGLDEGPEGTARLTLPFLEYITVAPVIGIQHTDDKTEAVGDQIMTPQPDAGGIDGIGYERIGQADDAELDELEETGTLHRTRPAAS